MVAFIVSPMIDLWCSRISCIISIIVVVFLLIHQKYKLTQRRKESYSIQQKKSSSFKWFISDSRNNDENNKVSWSLVSSYFLLLFSIITLISCILIEWTDSFSWYRFYYKYESYSIAIGYAVSKFSLYTLLSYRIEESFINSSYSYNKTFIWLWRIYLFLGVVIFIGCYVLHTNINIYKLKTSYPQWLVIYAVIFDFIACLINLILFTRQLWSFTEDCNEYTMSTNYQFVEEFKTIIKKQVLLAIISIISTLLSLITVIIFGIPVLCVSFDLAVTNICVVLMFSWNHNLVIFCCGKCLKQIINDNVIESIALSKVSTGRLSKVPANLSNLPTLDKIPETPSFTATCTSMNEFSSFPNHQSHRKTRLTPIPSLTAPSPTSSNNNELSTSFSIDCLSTKTIITTTNNEENNNEENKNKIISEKPKVFLKINAGIRQSQSSQSMDSVYSISNSNGSSIDIFNTTPSSNQSTPNSCSTLSIPTKFPMPMRSSNSTNSILTGLDEIDENYADDADDDDDDDEVP